MAGPAAPPETTEHLAFIDALRGWAFLGVLAVHVHSTLVRLPERSAQFATSGNYGVQLFFVVSSLTLVMSYRSRIRRDRRPIAAFLIRRFFRIAPLFWLAIPTYLWFFGTGPGPQAPDGIHSAQVLATLFFVHGWHPTSINSVVPGGWSIAVEMNFYLMFPLFFALLTSLRRSLIACAGLFPLSIAVSFAARKLLTPAFEEGLVQRFTYFWLPRELPVFVLGFVLFFLIARFKNPPSGVARAPGRWVLRFLPEGSVVLLLVMAYVSDRLPLAYFWFSCGFVSLALGLSWRPVFFLVNPVTQYLGKLSYSAYITHFIVMGVAGKWLVGTIAGLGWNNQAPWVFAVAYVVCGAGTVLLSSLTYRFVETPGQGLGRSLIRRLGYGVLAIRTQTGAASSEAHVAANEAHDGSFP